MRVSVSASVCHRLHLLRVSIHLSDGLRGPSARTPCNPSAPQSLRRTTPPRKWEPAGQYQKMCESGIHDTPHTSKPTQGRTVRSVYHGGQQQCHKHHQGRGGQRMRKPRHRGWRALPTVHGKGAPYSPAAPRPPIRGHAPSKGERDERTAGAETGTHRVAPPTTMTAQSDDSERGPRSGTPLDLPTGASPRQPSVAVWRTGARGAGGLNEWCACAPTCIRTRGPRFSEAQSGCRSLADVALGGCAMICVI